MKKKGLWVSFWWIVIVPILIGILLMAVLLRSQMNHIKSTEAYGTGIYSFLVNVYATANQMTDEEYQNIKEICQRNPAQIEDEGFLERTNERLQEDLSAIVYCVDGSLIYDGTNMSCWGVELPEYGTMPSDFEEGRIVGTKEQVMLKQIDFLSAEGRPCSIYILTDLSEYVPHARSLLVLIAIGLIGLVVISAVTVFIWTKRGILTPIRKLEAATKRISQGDLDFTLEVTGEDEIASLCENFEQMRKRLKESAEEKVNQDMQNKLLISNICHDLKTPITSIQGYVEGILDGVANTPEKQEKYIKTIYNKAKEMNTLINELTIYSKLDTNRVPYNFQRINVAGYFEDCVDELKTELEAENVILSYYNYSGDEIEVIADPEQLSRVIHNIVSNAVKYMNKPIRQINVRIKDVGDFIQVEIEDNAKGIAVKDLPYIFERFYRADSSRNETKGSGIGLSIVKKIIEDHGGKIWATSKENVGTTMYFVLRKYQEVPYE